MTVTETHVDLDPADVALAERDRQVSKADVATLRNLEYGIAQLQAQLAHKTLLRDELLERLAVPTEEAPARPVVKVYDGVIDTAA